VKKLTVSKEKHEILEEILKFVFVSCTTSI